MMTQEYLQRIIDYDPESASLMFVTPYSGLVGMYIFSNMLVVCWGIVVCTLDMYGMLK